MTQRAVLAGGEVSIDSDVYAGVIDIFFDSSPRPVTQNIRLDADFLGALYDQAADSGSDVVLPVGYVLGAKMAEDTLTAAAATYGAGDDALPLLGVAASPILYDGVTAFSAEGGEFTIAVLIQGYFDIAGCAFPSAFTDAAHKLAAPYQGAGVFPGSNILFGRKSYDGVIADPSFDAPSVGDDWLLAGGVWSDSGVWSDTGIWAD